MHLIKMSEINCGANSSGKNRQDIASSGKGFLILEILADVYLAGVRQVLEDCQIWRILDLR